ncbi:MAG: hypothetical protein HC866_03810 [Leptolyngbyaceae cyanobacterium RU_5_1]|nr:hypothetical protein [Leptolyngbyaceae cyanobacterium RU_5_1]
MKLKAVWLTAAGFTTLGLIAAGSLRGVSQQMWNPQVARAAKVTVNLLKGRSMNPILLARSTRPSAKIAQPISVRFTNSNELIRYTLNRRDLLSYSSTQLGQLSQLSIGPRKLPDDTVTEQAIFEPHDFSDLQDSTFQNWDGSVEGTLKKQNYQIRKLEFELAREQFNDGKISKSTFNQKSRQYQVASQEFKAFLDSSRMADQP